MKIGWIGLGKMGAPMAANLLKAGYALAVHNRSPDKAKPFVDAGASHAESPADLGRSCEVVVSMVADDAALSDITLGPGGLFEEACKGLVYVDMSTVSPEASQRIARAAAGKGIGYLRAPVSGSTAKASAGALSVFVSGSHSDYQQCLPWLGCIGDKLHYLGDAEQARYAKIAINMMVGITAAMVGEALVIGERGGVGWEQMIDVINGSVVTSPLIGYKSKQLAKRDFQPMFTVSQMAKDFDLALDTGRATDVPMPLTAVARQFFAAMAATGRGGADFFAYVTLLEELAGLGSHTADKTR